MKSKKIDWQSHFEQIQLSAESIMTTLCFLGSYSRSHPKYAFAQQKLYDNVVLLNRLLNDNIKPEFPLEPTHSSATLSALYAACEISDEIPNAPEELVELGGRVWSDLDSGDSFPECGRIIDDKKWFCAIRKLCGRAMERAADRKPAPAPATLTSEKRIKGIVERLRVQGNESKKHTKANARAYLSKNRTRWPDEFAIALKRYADSKQNGHSGGAAN